MYTRVVLGASMREDKIQGNPGLEATADFCTNAAVRKLSINVQHLQFVSISADPLTPIGVTVESGACEVPMPFWSRAQHPSSGIMSCALQQLRGIELV